MSDKFVPYYSRDNNTSADREQSQQQSRSRTILKKEENAQFSERYPPFVVPVDIYKVVHVNKYVSIDDMHLVVNHVQECVQFTLDTESERSNGELALIQIQTVPYRLPILVILVELKHLPSNNQNTYVKVKELFTLLFRSGNQLYSWGDIGKELEPVKDYHLANWPIAASLINIQLYYPEWYKWALAHCESCRPDYYHHHQDVIQNVNINVQDYSSIKCVCHDPSPYGQNELWSLQKALIYAAHMFIDKSCTVNNWAAGLTSNNSTLSRDRRNKMNTYAIYDCFSTTYLIRPVLECWTFKQLQNTNIIELFTSFKLPPLPAIKLPIKKIKKNINLQQLFNSIDDELEPISDDEIYFNQLIAPVIEQRENEEILNEKQELNNTELIINVEDQSSDLNDIEEIKSSEDFVVNPSTRKNKPHHQRTHASRKKRNKKRNDTHRKRRYQYYVTEPWYYKYTMKLVRKVLDDYHIDYVHVKEVDGNLVIGLKNEMNKRKYQQEIPQDIFHRNNYQRHYQRYRRH